MEKKECRTSHQGKEGYGSNNQKIKPLDHTKVKFFSPRGNEIKTILYLKGEIFKSNNSMLVIDLDDCVFTNVKRTIKDR